MDTQLPLFRFDEHGLIPCVVQDWLDGTVLMVGFMNQKAWDTTQETGRVHFWSRSRKRLWKKGESSGHELLVKELFLDCDQDTVLVKAQPVGPTCHTGNRSCFYTPEGHGNISVELPMGTSWGGIVQRLYEMVLHRKTQPAPDSYVSKLLSGGVDRVLKKVVEESGEVIIAGKNASKEEIIYEMADLWFHSLIMLGHFEISPLEVEEELGKRFGKSGIRPTSTGGSHG
ncbi:MAG: bifunctional phosphoribosyl-AMP cyclohydrolase/phosphoribosyl-ATP diphosphatase HisIE [Nitrospira sp.]|nr:bifunctional phosphoribosyl-AMP cyclohydrolase/phosphoribosyl-ATP diphosphatase HisIE [Nitrospira sp.]MCB9709837.1 bifunctional phosphoribosyl-AMP cyclohydrolase/phosphoribosyl-ATP diphosphatase HisIE [Nitrospiraceae bacterium]MDR4485956.1 bifunctional phosphoribosyl-AMP cyclohydrolase/phosphoribosyl-ATP diphosphatase HisIE [Nitrospirales bacterium]MCA9463925.1 bifunctional phosphoribosyl-AMP cyclohydrolase/phosphoribosyl-ATP diphosphatase HisIE [Nitrospira sp.]MCA9475573.1 bifunctional phos